MENAVIKSEDRDFDTGVVPGNTVIDDIDIIEAIIKDTILAGIGIDDDTLAQAVAQHPLQAVPHLYVFSGSPYRP